MAAIAENTPGLPEEDIMQLPPEILAMILGTLVTDDAADQAIFKALRSVCKRFSTAAYYVQPTVHFKTSDLLHVKHFLGKLKCINAVTICSTWGTSLTPSLDFLSTHPACQELNKLTVIGLDQLKAEHFSQAQQHASRVDLDLSSLALAWCSKLTHLEISHCRCNFIHILSKLNVIDGSGSSTVISNGHNHGTTGSISSSNRDVAGACSRVSTFLAAYSPALKSLKLRHVSPPLKEVDMCWLRGLQQLTCCGSMGAQQLNMLNWQELQHLDCSGNDIVEIDISHCYALKSLDCSQNKLARLNVACCTALLTLQTHHNNTPDLYTSTCTSLQSLDCSHSSIDTLLLPHTATLQHLDCSHNEVRLLELLNMASLRHLNCSWNLLYMLNLEESSGLEWLDCSHNGIQGITPFSCVKLQRVLACSKLQHMDCFSNRLHFLHMAASKDLLHLDCSRNHIPRLNVSRNTSLQSLKCADNLMTQLFIPNTATLTLLNCSRNKLSLLDVSQNTGLLHLDCQANQLRDLSVDACTSLQTIDYSSNALREINKFSSPFVYRINASGQRRRL